MELNIYIYIDQDLVLGVTYVYIAQDSVLRVKYVYIYICINIYIPGPCPWSYTNMCSLVPL